MYHLTRSLGIIWATALLMTSVSCYRLIPTDGGAPTIGRELVLELSERGAIELAPQLGVQLQSVTGRVSGFSNDVYDLAVTQTNSRSGVETIWRGEPVSIPRSSVVRVGERQLDRRRTWIVVGMTTITAALAGRAFGINTGLDGLLGGRGGGGRQ